MSSRWFIPLSLLIFAALFGGLWAYLSATEEPTPSKWVRSSGGMLKDLEEITATRKPVAPAPPAQVAVAKPRPVRHSLRPPQASWSNIAEKLDEATVKARSEASDLHAVELLSAQRELEAGRPEIALRGFDRVLRQSRANTVAMAGRASALVALNRLDDAEAAYAQLVKTAPRDVPARYNYGVLLYRRAKYGEATTQFRELVVLQPTHARGQYNLATLAQRAGRLVEAREAWTAFTRLEPAVPSGWFNLGVSLIDFEEPLEAARCFAIFTTLRPTEADGQTNLGAALAAAGYLPEALDALALADALSPCDATILAAMADIHEACAASGGPEAAGHHAEALCINEQLASME